MLVYLILHRCDRINQVDSRGINSHAIIVEVYTAKYYLLFTVFVYIIQKETYRQTPNCNILRY